MGDNIRAKLLFVGLLVLSYGLIVSSAVEKSATVDEQSHLFRGVAYIRTGATHFLLGHPILGGTFSALPLITERTIKLPEDDPSWEAGNWSVAADSFLWKLNDNPQRLIFLGRLSVMWLTLFLGALIFRWGSEMAGKGAAIVAAALFLLDPNVLAHGKLITSDIPVSLFITLAVFGYWRFSRYRSGNGQWINLVLCGVGMGLAAATKFNAAILIPIFALLGIWLTLKERSWRPILGLLFAVVIAWIVVWLVYGMAWRPLPGGAFWDDLLWEIRYFEKPHGSYLAGQYSVDGWWYYFPLTFLLKTPVPTLILLVAAITLAISGIRSRRENNKKNQTIHHLIFLIVPPLLYLLASLFTSLNIGYRYLLPMFPFLVLFVGVTLSKRWTEGLFPSRAVRWLPAPFIILLLIISVVVWPDYISYFNLIAGGQDDGWRILSDSNVD